MRKTIVIKGKKVKCRVLENKEPILTTDYAEGPIGKFYRLKGSSGEIWLSSKYGPVYRPLNPKPAKAKLGKKVKSWDKWMVFCKYCKEPKNFIIYDDSYMAEYAKVRGLDVVLPVTITPRKTKDKS